MNTRIYTQVYTHQVQTGDITNENVKIFFKSGLSYLKEKTIKAITINYDTFNIGTTATGYLTLVDSNHNTILYNYPFRDLHGTTKSFPLRLRLFNLKNIELQNSYFFYRNLINPITAGKLFDINFYFED